jgi:hypothetical protein
MWHVVAVVVLLVDAGGETGVCGLIHRNSRIACTLQASAGEELGNVSTNALHLHSQHVHVMDGWITPGSQGEA